MTQINSMVLINFFLIFVSFWACWYVYERYYRRIEIDRRRYRLFALRDRLTLLVMKGKIAEGSTEHLFLLTVLNKTIKSINTFRITSFLRFIIRLYDDKTFQEYIEKIHGQLDQTPNTEYAAIIQEFSQLAAEIMADNMFTLKIIFVPVSIIAWIFRFQNKLTDMRLRIKRTYQNLRETEKKFAFT
ncbi:MAG: hypothetical protein H7832_05910 [Magnetococcus sp. DMHC-6]